VSGSSCGAGEVSIAAICESGGNLTPASTQDQTAGNCGAGGALKNICVKVSP
jgi:hypothetical protein